jgi:hypothetical protein
MAQLDFQINVSGNSKDAIGSLKKQLREATAEVAILSDKFGATSEEAIKAAKRAAELRDRIGDAKALTEAFNPDAKFKALTASLSGVAGGFAAVQGAIGLFGTESKNVEKALLKVQSAMALSQGLQAIGESVDSFKQLKAVVIDVGSKAFGSLRAAIISTGIGALVIGLGLLIANFEKVKKVVLDFIPGLGRVADFIGNLVNKVTDFIGITSEAGRATAKLIKENEKAIKDGERFLDLNADKYDEYTQRKIKANLEFKKRQNEFLNDEALSEAEKIKFVKEAREKANREILSADNDRINKQNEANQKAYEEQQKLAKERRDAEIKAEEEYQRQNQANAERRKADLKRGQEEIDKENAARKEQQQKDAEDADIRLTERANNALQILKDTTDAQFEQQKKAAEDEQAILDARLFAQLEFASALGSIFGNLSNLFEQGTTASKVAALAEIGIQSGVGLVQGLDIAQKSAKGTGPAAAFAFPIFYATQVAAVLSAVSKAKSILSSVKGGGSSSTPSMPMVSTSAPITPQAPQAQMTQLNAQTINALGNQAIKAYVVETDVTTNQQRIKAIQQRARFD